MFFGYLIIAPEKTTRLPNFPILQSGRWMCIKNNTMTTILLLDLESFIASNKQLPNENQDLIHVNKYLNHKQ